MNTNIFYKYNHCKPASAQLCLYIPSVHSLYTRRTGVNTPTNTSPSHTHTHTCTSTDTHRHRIQAITDQHTPLGFLSLMCLVHSVGKERGGTHKQHKHTDTHTHHSHKRTCVNFHLIFFRFKISS